MSFKLRFRAVRASNRPYYGVIFLRTGWTWQNLKAERHRYRLRRFYGLGQAFDQSLSEPGVPLGLGRPQFISATGGQSYLKSCDEQLLAARPSSYIRHYSPWLSRDPEVHQCACWHVGTRAARLGSCYLPTRNLRRQRAVTGPNNETKSSTVAKPKGSAIIAPVPMSAPTPTQSIAQSELIRHILFLYLPRLAIGRLFQRQSGAIREFAHKPYEPSDGFFAVIWTTYDVRVLSNPPNN
ncbi:hypothetical protein C8J57DRAFT_1256798 [Mycena rebaudengoi]|nr:hypothetical protein C8J57DRAFT_1256798 [Mycena rebaudengoi]